MIPSTVDSSLVPPGNCRAELHLVADDTPFLRDVEAAWCALSVRSQLACCRVTSAFRTLATRNGLVEELGCWKGCVPVPLRSVLSPKPLTH